MDQKLIAAISLVKSSRHRRKILDTIHNNMVTPSEISKESSIRLNHVSMYLSELKEGGLVECLNESAKKGRLYQLTEFGKKVIKTIG